MHRFILVLIVLVLLIPTGCRNRTTTSAPQNAAARCLDDISSIPGLAATLKSREKNENPDSRPLDGMEVALTLSDLVRSHSDSEEEIDDWCYSQNSRENFFKLVAGLRQSRLPPTVSFVVGSDLDPSLSESWLQSGNLLGNMTFSRMKVRKQTPDQFILDIALNEQALAASLKKFNQKQKYFRYPRLKPSRDAEAASQIRTFLKENGYVEVTATIEAQDHKFSEVYCEAQARGDNKCAGLVKDYFKSLLLDTTIRSRGVAQTMAGHDVKHILLLKANQLVIDTLAELITWYRALGARFISIDEALKDPFYSVVDDEENSGPQGVVKEVIRAQKWEKQ